MRGIGETGLDYYRDYSPREDQLRAFEAQIDLARSRGKPLVIHTRAADDDTLELLHRRADGLRVILHCFSMADRVLECLEHDQWWFSFAGNSTYPKAHDLRAAALRIPAERSWSRPTLPICLRSPCAAPRTSRPTWLPPRRRSRSSAGCRTPSSSGRSSGAPRRRSDGECARLADAHAGQNFLVDRNILTVIERLASLSADDVVLRDRRGTRGAVRAAGHTRRAPARGRDRRPPGGSPARDAGSVSNVTLHLTDALGLDLAGL